MTIMLEATTRRRSLLELPLRRQTSLHGGHPPHECCRAAIDTTSKLPGAELPQPSPPPHNPITATHTTAGPIPDLPSQPQLFLPGPSRRRPLPDHCSDERTKREEERSGGNEQGRLGFWLAPLPSAVAAIASATCHRRASLLRSITIGDSNPDRRLSPLSSTLIAPLLRHQQQPPDATAATVSLCSPATPPHGRARAYRRRESGKEGESFGLGR